MKTEKEVLENTLDFLPPKFDFYSQVIAKEVQKVSFEVGQLNGYLKAISNPDLVLMPMVVTESVASSNIENIQSTLINQLQLELYGRKPYKQEEKETSNYKLALLRGYDYIIKNNRFDLELILLVHDILEPNLKGFRDKEPLVIANNSTGQIIWAPPKGREKILKYLENWLEWLNNENPDENVFVKSVILHSQFEAIHPFVDGNGRTGRILLLLYLVFNNVLNYPALFLSQYIMKTRTYYYLYLQEAQQENNYFNLINYFLKGISQKAEETIGSIKAVLELKKDASFEIKAKLPKIYTLELLDYLFENAFYSQRSMVEKLKITRITASKYLKLLLENGFIENYSSSKEVIYCNKKMLEVLI